MAQTVIEVQDMKKPFYQPAANELDLTMVAADAVNGNSFVCTGREILIAHNTGASARTLTISSVAGDDGRTGDINAYSIGAGEYAYFPQGLTQKRGWIQTSGVINVLANNAEVKLGILRLP